MKKLILAAIAAAAIPAAAWAQDATTGAYAGIEGGYHDFQGGAESPLLGGYIGYDFPLGTSGLVAGLEANASAAIEGDTDAEYGASAHLGFMSGTSKFFGRVGYQEVEFDGPGSDGDVMYGVGGEFAVGTNSAFRVTVDTITFDTARVGAGLTFRF